MKMASSVVAEEAVSLNLAPAEVAIGIAAEIEQRWILHNCGKRFAILSMITLLKPEKFADQTLLNQRNTSMAFAMNLWTIAPIKND